MESVDPGIKTAYLENISQLEALRDNLSLEREKLIHFDSDGLWVLSKEKQRILKELEQGGEALKSRDDTPPGFRDLSKKMILLKEEVRVRAAENMCMIRETLEFFDELLSIFLQEREENGAYGRQAAPRRKSQPLKVSREV